MSTFRAVIFKGFWPALRQDQHRFDSYQAAVQWCERKNIYVGDIELTDRGPETVWARIEQIV